MIRMNLSTLFTSHGAPILLDDEYLPTYIAIINKKDGTTTTKCLNPSRRRSSSSASVHPLKKRLVGSSSLLPKFRIQTIGGGGSARRGTLTKQHHSNDKDLKYYLPLEIIQGILVYLDYTSLLTLSTTSRYYHRLCQGDYIWYTRFTLDFHTPHHTFQQQHQALYRNHRILHRRWMDGQVATQYLHGHQDSVYCMARLGPHQLISGSRDRSIKVWNLQSRQQGNKKPGLVVMTKMTTHDGSVLCLKVSQDGKTMLSGSSDATCILWCLDTFQPLLTLRGHSHGVLDICMVGDDYYVSASRDHTLCVWEAFSSDKTSGKMVHRLLGHHGPVNALDAYGDYHVVSASGDGSLKLWNIHTGECITTFKDNNNNNNTNDNGDTTQQGLACVRCDRKRGLIYSGGQDGKLRIWDVASGQCLVSLSGHHGLIRTMDLMQGGNILVTG
ncbi:WD40-repeat-containing domain protein, partial [Chlamydoabsidia padenii]